MDGPLLPHLSEISARARRILNLSTDPDVVHVGGGSDHWAFVVNAVFIARVSKTADEQTPHAVIREAALLDVLAKVSPVPIPQVIAADPASGFVVYRRLPGTPLLEAPPFNPLNLAQPLAAFVAAIHGAPLGLLEHVVPRDEYPLTGYVTEAAARLPGIAGCLTNAQRRRVERFLAGAVPPEPHVLTMCHNDLGAEHVLASADRSELTGIIDWSDAAIADPARDIGRLFRDFGAGVAEVVLRRTHGDQATMTRAVFHARCALLEDLAYGIEATRTRYLSHALARFDETFA